jgi:hypothetical protein
LITGSIGASFGLGAFGGGLGSFVSQMIDYGASNVEWNKILFDSISYGVFGLISSLIPQGVVVKPLGNGWVSAFCVGGEIIIDAATWFYERVVSGKIKLPRPILL